MDILGIGAHPDDIEFGCGGTFAKFARAGHRVHMLIVTSGELGGDSRLRRREAERAAGLLKARLYWGGFHDTDIPMTRELIQAIEGRIRRIRPDLIFTHYYDDTHQDHRKVAQATTTAARYARNVLSYEVPSTLEFAPSVYVDIGRFLPRKFALLQAHRSQVRQTRVPGLSILDSARSTAVFRGFRDRVKHAEAFVPIRLSLDFALR